MKFDIWVFFEKSVQKIAKFFKIWQELLVLYMKTTIQFCSYLAQFFLEWEMFQTKVLEKVNTHLKFKTFILKNRAFMR